MAKKIILVILFTTFFSQNVKASDFEQNLLKWLMSLGFDGKIHEVSKVYDGDGFIDYFYLQLEEYAPEEKTNPFISAQLFNDNINQFISIKLENKDLSGTKFLIADWVARFVINYAIKRIAKLLSLQVKIKKTQGDLYKITLDPAKTTQASRYRFEQIEIFYQVVDKIVSLQATVRAPSNYLIAEFAKGKLNALLRTLEQGGTPALTFRKTSYESAPESLSNQLMREFLKQPEEAVSEESQDPAEF